MSLTPSAIHDTPDIRRVLPIQLPQMPNCPKEWFSLEGSSPLAANELLQLAIRRKLIDHLLPFERIAQAFVLNLLDKVGGTKTPYISIGDLTLELAEFSELVKHGKFGMKLCPSLQQAALDMVEAAAEREGFSLGEFKLIYCVASLTGLIGLIRHTEKPGSAGTQMLEEQLGKAWDGFNTVEYCVDIVKLKEFLRRLLDYHTAVLLPMYRDWER